jgi:hypothetical protein
MAGIFDRRVSGETLFTNTTIGTVMSIPLSDFGTSASAGNLFVKATTYATFPGMADGIQWAQIEVLHTAVRYKAGPTYVLAPNTLKVRELGTLITTTNGTSIDISSGNLRVRWINDPDAESDDLTVRVFTIVELSRII